MDSEKSKVRIPCCWKGCEKEADPDITGRCPWGDFAFCEEHDDAMHEDYAKYCKKNGIGKNE